MEKKTRDKYQDRREFLISIASIGIIPHFLSCDPGQSYKQGRDPNPGREGNDEMLVQFPIDYLIPPKPYHDYRGGLTFSRNQGSGLVTRAIRYIIEKNFVFLLDYINVNISFEENITAGNTRALDNIFIYTPDDSIVGNIATPIITTWVGGNGINLVKPLPILFLPDSSFVLYVSHTANIGAGGICRVEVLFQGRHFNDTDHVYSIGLRDNYPFVPTAEAPIPGTPRWFSV